MPTNSKSGADAARVHKRHMALQRRPLGIGDQIAERRFTGTVLGPGEVGRDVAY